MNTVIPNWAKVSVYFLVIILAAYLTSFIPALDSIFFYFAIAFLLTLAFMHAERRPLKSLGFIPKGRAGWKDFFAGLGIGMLMLALTVTLTLWFSGNSLRFSGRLDLVYLLILIVIHFWSSFAQEFTYRGYPFQTLLCRYGTLTAQLVTIFPFAIMHLKLGTHISPAQFGMTLLTTGLGSVLYGLAYIKTKSMVLPIGLHMGWNLAQALVPRSPKEAGSAVFIIEQGGDTYNPLAILLPYLGVTLLAILVLIWTSIFKKHT